MIKKWRAGAGRSGLLRRVTGGALAGRRLGDWDGARTPGDSDRRSSPVVTLGVGVDVSMDVGVDVGVDVGMDVGVDVGIDVGVGPRAARLSGRRWGIG